MRHRTSARSPLSRWGEKERDARNWFLKANVTSRFTFLRVSVQHGSWGFAHQFHPGNRARHPVKMALSNVCCWALLTGRDLMMSGIQTEENL